jgi:dsRNA-specific ribonuclease
MQENTNERLEFLGDSVIALTVTTIATNATETRTEAFFDQTTNATGFRRYVG